MSDALIAAGIMASTSIRVVTDSQVNEDKSIDKNRLRELTVENIHQYQLVQGPVSPVPTTSRGMTQIFLKTLTGKTIDIFCDITGLVEDIKTEVYHREGIPPEEQRLFFARNELENTRVLSDYNVQSHSTLHLVLRFRGGGDVVYHLSLEGFLDPKYDYDFTKVNDTGLKFKRGGFDYGRPCGWKRSALQVLNKYAENVWLGATSIRKTDEASVPDEWAVSYHGTAKHNGRSIAEDGYLLCKGKRFLFGSGIYSTPDINVAALYSREFTFEGSTYKLVIQNRVNPKSLIRIPKEQTNVGEYWISPNEKDIRPYGFCIKKM